MKKSKIQKIFSLIIIVIIFFTANTYTFGAQTAQNMPDNSNVEYTLLEPLPDLDKGANSTVSTIKFSDYVKYTFNLFVAISAAAAVFMIVLGGFQYITTDSWMGKNEGVKKVTNALLGLLLVLGSYLLLRTIDPRLVEIPSTLVKPLKIEYDKTAFGFLEQLKSEVEKYHTDINLRKGEIEKSQQTIDGLIAENDGYIKQIREFFDDYESTDEEILKMCEGEWDSDQIGNECFELILNQDLIANEKSNQKLQVALAALDQQLYITGPSVGSKAHDYSKDIQILNEVYNQKREVLVSSGANSDQLKSLWQYKNYVEAGIKINQEASKIYDLGIKYNSQTPAVQGIGFMGEAMDSALGNLSYINPTSYIIDWGSYSKTEFNNDLVKFKNQFNTNSSKILADYKDELDSSTYQKLLNDVEEQKKNFNSIQPAK